MGVQVMLQLTPTMQAYVMADPKFKSQTCGKNIICAQLLY